MLAASVEFTETMVQSDIEKGAVRHAGVIQLTKKGVVLTGPSTNEGKKE